MNRSITQDSGKTSPALDRELEAAITAHDQATGEGIKVWIGAEPTFTDRLSEAPEWLSEALGEDKEQRARALFTKLHEAHPGAVCLRTLGRQYAREPKPRWCYGLYARRDGRPVWSGPPDRLVDGKPSAANLTQLPQFRASLVEALSAAGWAAETVTLAYAPEAQDAPEVQDAPEAQDAPAAQAQDTGESVRFVCRREGSIGCCDPSVDPRLGRATIHQGPVEGAGLVDDLADDGDLLVLLHAG